jgi:hypothetical protein
MMFEYPGCFRKLCLLSAFIFLGSWIVRAQDSAIEEIKYKEDYDRIQSIVKTTNPVKRAEQIVAFFSGRNDINPQIRDFAADYLSRDLEALLKQSNYTALKGICERTIKSQPKFGEIYLYYAAVLRNENKLEEAMAAYAKCYLIRNPFKSKAKQLLDVLYKSQNRGSLAGEDNYLRKVAATLK